MQKLPRVGGARGFAGDRTFWTIRCCPAKGVRHRASSLLSTDAIHDARGDEEQPLSNASNAFPRQGAAERRRIRMVASILGEGARKICSSLLGAQQFLRNLLTGCRLLLRPVKVPSNLVVAIPLLLKRGLCFATKLGSLVRIHTGWIPSKNHRPGAVEWKGFAGCVHLVEAMFSSERGCRDQHFSCDSQSSRQRGAPGALPFR